MLLNLKNGLWCTWNVPYRSCGVVMRLRTRSHENFTEPTRTKWYVYMTRDVPYSSCGKVIGNILKFSGWFTLSCT